MARDHARIHLDIWGDDDWLDLPADAQCLYMTLYTSPGRTLCGAHEWNPGRIKQRACDWSWERIEKAAEILSQRLFLIIDTDTEECLLRSWVKHDGLWRTPNMAVSVANARANLASRILRGVLVHEVRKLRDAEPDSTSWAKPAVQSMLAQNAIDPSGLEPFKGGSNGASKGGSNPAANGASKGGSKGGFNEKLTHGVKGGSNGGPTNAIPIAIATKRKDDVVETETLNVPEYIDNPARPTKRHPTSAAKTVVRQELGNAGYPRTTLEQLAIQVDKLAPHHDDTVIREALREWDKRENAIPAWLPSILGDVVKRARADPSSGKPPHKLRLLAEMATQQRANESAQQKAIE